MAYALLLVVASNACGKIAGLREAKEWADGGAQGVGGAGGAGGGGRAMGGGSAGSSARGGGPSGGSEGGATGGGRVGTAGTGGAAMAGRGGMETASGGISGGGRSGSAAGGSVSTGGVATGGLATGGVSTGGAAAGGTSTGGLATGGTSTGRAGTGAAACPTPSPCSVVGATSCAGDASSASTTARLTCKQDTNGCFYLERTSCGPLPNVCERGSSVVSLMIAPDCADSSQTAWRLPELGPTNYTDNGDGTVTDNVTGLMWQQKSTAFDGSQRNDTAIAACFNLPLGGHHDWRLPRRVELATLIDYTQTSPPMINKAFPDTASTPTQAEYATSSGRFSVDFATGAVDDHRAMFFRCVR